MLPSFLETKSGWGIDLIWHSKLDAATERMAIVDEVSVTHTRPLGGALYKNNTFEESPGEEVVRVYAEGKAIEAIRTYYGVTRWGGVKVSPTLLKPLGFLAARSHSLNGVVRRRSLAQTP